MTFKLNQNSVSRRRYGSSTSFSVSSGTSSQGPWTNTGAGGALVFDGTPNSYIEYENNGQFNLGTGDFTVEWWQYETDNNGAPRPWSFGAYPSAQFGVSFEGQAIVWANGGVFFTAGLLQPVQNTRNHFALVKQQGITTLWQNGQLIGSAADQNTYNLTAPLTIGSEGAPDSISCFGGTITNFNMLTYAKYSNPFIPTNTALSIDPNARIFVPATTQELWTEPYGDYVGTVSSGSNAAWAQVSPFKFPAPNPLVTFPYAPVTSLVQVYGSKDCCYEYGCNIWSYIPAGATLTYYSNACPGSGRASWYTYEQQNICPDGGTYNSGTGMGEA